MKQISFINGSPRGNNSFSFTLLKQLETITKGEKYFINTNFKGKYDDEVFKKLANSDDIIIAFPLYYYCIPGILLNLLEQYYKYNINKKGNSANVYVIVNCGFPEPQINDEAINVIRNFSSKVGFNFRFAISIGSGGFIDATKNIPVFNKNMKNINNALERIKNDIYDQCKKQFCDDIMLEPSSPRWLVLFFSGRSWYPLGKKNGLSKKDLYRRPYVEERY